MTVPVLKVALDVPLDSLFDYLDNGSGVKRGQRVLVTFGRRRMIGIVLDAEGTAEVADRQLKVIEQAFVEEPALPESTLKLIGFCAGYYHYPFGQALLSVLPSLMRDRMPVGLPKMTVYSLTAAGMAAEGAAIPARAVLQQRIFAALKSSAGLTAAGLAALGVSWRAAVKALVEKGWVAMRERELGLSGGAPVLASGQTPALLPDQARVVEAMLTEGAGFKVWLLHGVTGSGKTEVYMRLLDSVLGTAGAQALVLVPEINLTPQLEARFRLRFPQFPIVMLHSQMNESERLHGWMRAQSGEVRIVIGTRLAVFTPMAQLACIVVDEEHDSSYKQQDGMRYSARDIAISRAKFAGVPVVLGSATPSLESWHNARSGRYRLLSLTQRAVSAAALPQIRYVDTRIQAGRDGISSPLLEALRQRLERGEQSLLFINRRGYSPVLLCSSCNWIAPCARCSCRLVVHLRHRRLRCHHCGFEQRIPSQCPGCGNPDLHPTGYGTQRLEEVLAEALPQARILRVDRDSMRRKHALRDMTSRVHANEVDILIGTQMLAKGHDFPNLTLVGVVETDSALFSPDVRAAERLFAQLMQVAGRAGRAEKPGEVLVQTNFPDHVLFHALQKQDYPEFAASMLEERKLAQFPPYCFEAMLRAEATDVAPVMAFLEQAASLARHIAAEVTVYDPVRPQMERLKGMERAQLLIQSESRPVLQVFLQAWMVQLRALPAGGKVRWSLDVDPLES